MAKVSIRTVDKATPVPLPEASGHSQSRALFSGADPIHLAVHELGAGARMTITAHPTDIALFVWSGTVEADGAELGERSSAVVERGTSLRLTAGAAGARVLAFQAGSHEADKAGGHVHLLPRDRVPQTDCLGGNPGIGGALHADAQCPSCSVWLHENSYAMADKETPLHSHSEDEVIFVHSGSVRLGNRVYGPGTALAIAANTKYGFFSGPDGLGFVNFRATSPTYTSGDGTVSMDEAELWRGLLGRPEYLQPLG